MGLGRRYKCKQPFCGHQALLQTDDPRAIGFDPEYYLGRCHPESAHVGPLCNVKGRDDGFTKCLSREAANFGISVNAIAAGIFDTDLGHTLPERLLQMHDFWVAKGRVGRPEELAEYAAFMTSDRNSFMSGEIVIVDGGAIT